MYEVRINGITVQFPYEPYSVQKEYMEKIIESLRTGKNAILESPSGTGKTLSLLCATLGWIRHDGGLRKEERKRPNPKVIYATRTHSQILQAMKELKKTAYNDMKATVIASRHQLCIHPDLKDKSNTDKIYMCKKMMVGPNCSECKFYQNIDKNRKKPKLNENITDIEDLGSIGREHNCCPYYVAKQRAIESDIIFIPYSYLIDPTIRDANDIDLKHSIIILDEAHNVNRVCEDSASASIKVADISAALKDLNSINSGLYHFGGSGEKEIFERKLQNLKEILRSTQSDTHRGGYLFQLLKSVDIMEEQYSSIIKLLEDLFSSILNTGNNTDTNTEANESEKRGSGLKILLRFFQTISSSPFERRDDSYRVHIEKKLTENQAQQSHEDIPKYETILHFWCFNPQIRMENLLHQKIRCLILTSSTLTPFESFVAELGVPFQISFISRHIIEKHQQFAKILTSGSDGEIFNSKNCNRENKDYLLSIGRSIRDVSKKVPGGLLVFFPSYEFIKNCVKFWNEDGADGNTNIWNEISQQTVICVESRKKEEFECEIKKYYNQIRAKGRAIFIAVARGKISEGLDFSDIYGRCVMVIGCAFAPKLDPKIIEKKKHLDAERIERTRLPSGKEWYILDAIRTANQAMGRVIRHKLDYGAMLLCDGRYKKNQNHISPWIRARLNRQKSYTFSEIVEELPLFYANAEEELQPIPAPEINPESFILYEDDEWFSTMQISEQQPPEAAHQDVNDSFDETIEDIANTADSSMVSDQQPMDQQEEMNASEMGTSNKISSAEISSLNLPSSSRAMHVPDSVNSGDESDSESEVQPKRTRKSKKNTIASDSESDSSQRFGPLLNFIKNSLNETTYKKLKSIVSKYNNNGKYEPFRDELFKMFKEPKFVYYLKGSIIMFKKEHQPMFRKDSEQFIELCR